MRSTHQRFSIASLAPSLGVIGLPEKHIFLTRHLFVQVRDEIAARIASGVWKAGQMMPNEAELAAQFNVSQGTVRKALDLLESEKIITRKQGRGTFVVDHDTDEMAYRFCSIFDFEGKRVEGAITCECSEIGDAHEQELKNLNLVCGDHVFRSKRIHFHNEQPFMFEKISLAVRHFPNLKSENLENNRIASIAQQYGIHLAYAAERVSPANCPKDIAGRLQIEPEAMVLHLERTIYSDRAVRVEWREAWCHLQNRSYIVITS